MKESCCIICGERRDGIKVADDHVLRALRWFKTNVTRNVKNNELVVCKGCYPKYSKSRKRYTGRRAAYITLGALFLIFSIAVSVGSANALAIVAGIIIMVLMYLLSLVSYTPALQFEKKNAGNR